MHVLRCDRAPAPAIASLRLTVLSLATLALAGCAAFSPDGGFQAVEQLSRERTGLTPVDQRDAARADAARARVDALLQAPLSADSAVEIALLNHRGLQARYAELGIAEAERVRAGRLVNPSLSFGRLAGEGSVEIDRTLRLDLLGLLSLPLTTKLGQRRLEAAQLEAAQATVATATEARKAYIEAVAAQQLAGLHTRARSAADAARQLALRMEAAGHFSALDRLREQAFQADADTQLARAEHQALAARERLVRALGLGEAPRGFTLPDRLPELPAAPVEPAQAEQAAMDRRLDVQQARRLAEATAEDLGLSRTTRFINVLHLGLQNQSSTGEATRRGYEVELSLPLFDFGSARVARAEATYRQALESTAAVALRAQSEVREAHAAYRSAYALARHHRDEVLPLRQRIAEQQLLRYNGMLISVFELLADAREQIAAVAATVEALRDHWLAETDLHTALRTGTPAAAPRAASPPAAAAAPAGH